MDDRDENVEWPSAAECAAAKERASALNAGGLRFEAYLPPNLAVWLLDRIEAGDFIDPSEGIFVLVGEAKDLQPHADLRRELLRRSLDRAEDDPTLSAKEVERKLRERLSAPRPEPARWERPPINV